MTPPHRCFKTLLAPLAVLLVLTTSLAGCLTTEEKDVLGTFYPMTFLAQEIGGDAVSVGQIIPDHVEPHEWNPGVRDLARLSASHLAVAQGLGFEPWLVPLVDNLEDDAPPIVHTGDRLVEGEGLDAHDDQNASHDDDHDDHIDTQQDEHDGTEHDDGHGHDGTDPHTWIDPVQLSQQAKIVRDAMIVAFPEHEETMRANAAVLTDRLDALHHAFENRITLADCDTRNIVVQHNAFAHVANRYDFTVHSVVGLNPEAEPDPPAVARAIDEALAHNLSVVFTETLANPSVMNAVAQDATAKGTDVEVRVLSPLERRSPDEIEAGLDMIDIMHNNLDELTHAMRCT